jgi:hypothetical protein
MQGAPAKALSGFLPIDCSSASLSRTPQHANSAKIQTVLLGYVLRLDLALGSGDSFSKLFLRTAPKRSARGRMSTRKSGTVLVDSAKPRVLFFVLLSASISISSRTIERACVLWHLGYFCLRSCRARGESLFHRMPARGLRAQSARFPLPYC